MSQFLYVYRMNPADRQAVMAAPERAQQNMQRWRAWLQDLDARGHLKDRGQPLEYDGKVVRGPQRGVTDGPFAETKEVVAGFSIVEAKDVDEAIALTRGCPILDNGGTIEVRPIMKMDG